MARVLVDREVGKAAYYLAFDLILVTVPIRDDAIQMGEQVERGDDLWWHAYDRMARVKLLEEMGPAFERDREEERATALSYARQIGLDEPPEVSGEIVDIDLHQMGPIPLPPA